MPASRNFQRRCTKCGRSMLRHPDEGTEDCPITMSKRSRRAQKEESSTNSAKPVNHVFEETPVISTWGGRPAEPSLARPEQPFLTYGGGTVNSRLLPGEQQVHAAVMPNLHETPAPVQEISTPPNALGLYIPRNTTGGGFIHGPFVNNIVSAGHSSEDYSGDQVDPGSPMEISATDYGDAQGPSNRRSNLQPSMVSPNIVSGSQFSVRGSQRAEDARVPRRPRYDPLTGRSLEFQRRGRFYSTPFSFPSDAGPPPLSNQHDANMMEGPSRVGYHLPPPRPRDPMRRNLVQSHVTGAMEGSSRQLNYGLLPPPRPRDPVARTLDDLYNSQDLACRLAATHIDDALEDSDLPASSCPDFLSHGRKS